MESHWIFLVLLFGLVWGKPSNRQRFYRQLAFRPTWRGGAGVLEEHPHNFPYSPVDGPLIFERDTAKNIEQKEELPKLGNFADALNSDSLISPKRVPVWKSSLPIPLCNKGPQALQKLCISGNIDIYLLGTAHVSNDSSADVQLLLSHVDPDCIFVELCDARMALFENHQEEADDGTAKLEGIPHLSSVNVTWSERWRRWTTRRNTTHSSPGNNWFQSMSAVLLTSVQQDYAEKLGVELGGEFKCAHSYWYRKQRENLDQAAMNRRPHLILGDRPVQLTLMRAWESLSVWAKVKVCVGLLWSSLPWGKPNVEELRAWLASVMQTDGADILTQSLEELRRYFPTLYTTIIAERDAWLAAKLIQTCRALNHPQNQNRSRRQSIVAVVGAGHVPGIVHWLTTRTTQTPEEVLSTLVTTERWAKDETVQQSMIPNWIHEVVAVENLV